ncbi:hypothetical protein D9615_001837 [Tricholomella constricta]|uniref:Uncharacterized protein n=1 Tax=Tricholomella constricta TaxID=117010 RepID=A0A8H5HPH5_9AGAR|nr:hypothetical protein D9615_001837 [Tricholomella constricta]
MTISQAVPAPLATLPKKLSALLKQQNQNILNYLLDTNKHTTYFREAPLLSEFRAALQDDKTIQAKSSTIEKSSLQPQKPLKQFIETVPLSTYEDYRPYVSRFLESPRRSSDVSNLFAPGVPSYVISSSGTAGGPGKFYLKYRHPPLTSSSAIKAMKAFNPTSANTGGTYCIIYNLRYSDLLDVVDGDPASNQTVATVPLCLGSGAAFRTFHGWKVEDDSTLMTVKAPNTTSPLAICFIHVYRTSILMHALFSLEDRSLEMINTLFITFFVDLMRLIEEHWDVLVNAIDDGVVPKLNGSEDVHHYLQGQFKSNPARAAELRAVGTDTTSLGWAQRLWPNLQRVIGNASGPFSRVVPQVRHYVGSSVSVQSAGLTCSEAWLAQVYDPRRDLNLYKVSADDLFEYLDVSVPETAANLKRAWEIETGSNYELVLTTRDGLWRYRLSDVVEIAGFDPIDGQPIIRYLERRNVMMRVAHEFVTEKDLLNAALSLTSTLGEVIEFTVIIDDRPLPRAYGFMVELNGTPGPNAKSASSRLYDFLKSTNDTFAYFASRQLLGRPSIRLLAPGTFRRYREWKASNDLVGGGQIKVPMITLDEKAVGWLLNRVVEEV